MQKLREKLLALRRDEGGQSLVFVALLLFLMFLFVCVTVDVGDFVAQRVDAQSDADAMAISTAVWQARGLNLVQTLNVAKNLAHMHYMFEFVEVLWWIGEGQLIQAGLAALRPPEGLLQEHDDVEEELATLTLIQRYISGVGDMRDYGSVKSAIKEAITPIDRANNDSKFHTWSIALNQTAAADLVYDANLKIRFEDREEFYQVICDSDDWDCDSWILDAVFDWLEPDFTWAVQTDDAGDKQFTLGFAVRDVRKAPLFGGSFQTKTLVREVFGSSPIGWFLRDEINLAMAQAKPFKPDAYTIAPGTYRNGMSANVLGLPFATPIFGTPEGNTEAFWDVKLTPVTVLQSIAPPLHPLMTH